MTVRQTPQRPLDSALKERLHLRGNNPLPLRLIRAAIHGSDALSRLISGHPFIALKESEALLAQLHGLTGYAFVRALLAQGGGTRITARGLEHVPATGPVVIASTHPTGLFDFLAHADVLLDKRPDLKVVVNQEAERFLGSDIIVPVRIDKQNRAISGSDTRLAMHQHLDQGGALFIFGSGRVPDRKGARLVEPDWRGGATKASGAAGAPIIPAALNAQNSNAYYRLRAIARWLSGGDDNFGAMIGSLKYSAELLRKLGGEYAVRYGAPLDSGSDPDLIKTRAEALFPDLYGPADPPVTGNPAL